MAPKKIIIDTDPGLDDILALLLALSASSEELEVALVSLTFGNIGVEECLRNAVSMFHILHMERQWRIAKGMEPGFSALERCKPILAVGATCPIEDQLLEHDYFHGNDGLQGVHEAKTLSHLHYSPAEAWKHMFASSGTSNDPQMAVLPPNFRPSVIPAHKEILNILRENEPDTVTIVAVGPLANLALAANEDVETFLRAKEVVVMGGTLNVEGNITPVAEFNQYACSYSAARIYALTSPAPQSTMPPCRELQPYPVKLSRPLKLTTFPLDITNTTLLSLETFDQVTKLVLSPESPEKGSPLAQWVRYFVARTFDVIKDTLHGERDQDRFLALHDPLCIWYVLTSETGDWTINENVDVRVEVNGQWTRGMSVIDKRTKIKELDATKPPKASDSGGWLHAAMGNRVRIAVDLGDRDTFGAEMLKRIFLTTEGAKF
ncbi:nucleoside hydrolase [Pyronema omphalodes]|nr:nucleoside hydrolase [Pyronema omphalodes]